MSSGQIFLAPRYRRVHVGGRHPKSRSLARSSYRAGELWLGSRFRDRVCPLTVHPVLSMQKWNADQYAENVRFVSDLGGGVIDLLAPKAGERILDLGCGD